MTTKSNHELNAELIVAAQYAAEILSKIPAFGDTIGEQTTKFAIGIALNRLMVCLTAIAQAAKGQS